MKPIIIVVDDDPDDIEFFSSALNEMKADCDFKYFLNGIDFLQFFEKNINHNQPVAVAVDINMPMISGTELLQMLNTKKINRHIPIYVVTTADRQQHEKQ